MSEQALDSTAFYTRPSQTAKTVFLTILFIILTILIIIVILTLAANIQKKCTDPPPAPAKIEAGYIDSKTFRVRWSPVPTASKYTLYVGQTVSFTKAQAITTITTVRTSADVVDLDRNESYYLFVVAENTCGTSPESQRVVFVFVAS